MAAPAERQSATFRTASLAGLIALLVYAATTGGSYATDLASYEVTKNLVEQRSVAMSYDVLSATAERGVDGRFYAPVGIGHPVFGVPFYIGARLATAAGLRAGKADSIAKAGVVFGSAVAAALCVFFTCLLSGSLTGNPRTAAAAAFTLAFATPLWVYAKFGFNAPLAALCLAAGAAGAWIGTRRPSDAALVLGGAAIGYAVLTRHEMLIAALPLLLWCWLDTAHKPGRRLRTLALFGVPIVFGVIGWLTYNYVRFGNPFDTGLLRDPNVRLDNPLFSGLYGLLFTPGRSLFLYAPITLAAVSGIWRVWRDDRRAAVLLGGPPLFLLIFIAKMHQWDGGESYGPRYLVPALPFLITAAFAGLSQASSQRVRTAAVGLVFLGVLIQIPGVLVDYSKTQLAYARTRSDYSINLTRYTWEAAPLVLNTRASVTAVPKNIAYLTGMQAPPAVSNGDDADRDFSQRFAFSLDFWWLYLFYLKVLPAWAAVAVPLVLVGAALALWRLLAAELKALS